MNCRFVSCLWLGFVAAACDKTPPPAAASGGEAGQLRITKTERREPANARDALREKLTAASRLESAAEREKATASAAWDALELDPELAREAMDTLPPDSAERIRLIRHLAMRMAEENVDEALKWAMALGTEGERSAAIGHTALVLSETQPDRAAGLLSEFGIAGRGFNVVAVQVLDRWAAQSPPGAAAWVAVFPPGEAREAGLRAVISSWAETDPGAAMSWLASVADESVRQETALAMAMALLGQPEAARQEALAHADPGVRREIDAQWEAAKKETGHDDRPPSSNR